MKNDKSSTLPRSMDARAVASLHGRKPSGVTAWTPTQWRQCMHGRQPSGVSAWTPTQWRHCMDANSVASLHGRQPSGITAWTPTQWRQCMHGHQASDVTAWPASQWRHCMDAIVFWFTRYYSCHLYKHKQTTVRLTVRRGALFLSAGRSGTVTRYRFSRNLGALSFTSLTETYTGVTEKSSPSLTITRTSYCDWYSRSRAPAVLKVPGVQGTVRLFFV